MVSTGSPVPPSPSPTLSKQSYQSLRDHDEEPYEGLATSKGKLVSLSVFTIQLVLAVVILVFYGASAAMRDVSEAGLICIAITACTAVVLVTPVINQVAWKTADNNTDGYSARPEQAIISAERKFQHLIVAILYGLSISLLLLIGSNQHKALNITCVVLGSMTCVSHLLYSITLFVLHT